MALQVIKLLKLLLNYWYLYQYVRTWWLWIFFPAFITRTLMFLHQILNSHIRPGFRLDWKHLCVQWSCQHSASLPTKLPTFKIKVLAIKRRSQASNKRQHFLKSSDESRQIQRLQFFIQNYFHQTSRQVRHKLQDKTNKQLFFFSSQ